ncbi:tRNA (guanine-N1)-methyltransferase [Flavobacterium sp. H122]|uniref:tRNA (guanine-N1)-methyltransferase n=1 Tax=Flavobacterium sp. H122 TaxID=2529860 RepID=UPI0010AA1572|nr:tRNA (guanine-N1)-methyltransferase [Flavobacterium sp. H122]
MSKCRLVSWIVICFSIITSATGQETAATSNSIGNQFNYILEKSESYKDLKVVKKQWIENLKSDVLSSISKVESELNSSKMAFNQQAAQMNSLKVKLDKVNSELQEYTNSGPSITFLGIQFNKSFFNGLLSFILLGSVLSVAFFAYQFKKMNSESTHSKSVLNDLEEEYQEYKRKAIEREQKVSRQLQDELNKQKQFAN